MTFAQTSLIKSTFEQVKPIAGVAAGLFYGRLFELDPSLRPLFQGSMEEQGRKLMQMIEVVVRGLDRPEAIKPAVVSLGRRHAAYGVNARHYDTVGAALLWTLEAGLGAAFTPEARDAWASLYGWLAESMRAADA